MISLSWSIEGEKQLSRKLRDVGAGIRDWTPAFRETADELSKVFANDSFSTRGRIFNEPWKPLTPRYLAQKVKAGYPADPLVRTGKMKAAIRSLYKTDMAEVWNAVQYFKYHQSNKPRSSNLPRRVVMKLGENQKQVIVKIFHTFWNKMVTS